MCPATDDSDRGPGVSGSRKRFVLAPLVILLVLGSGVIAIWRSYCAETERGQALQLDLLSVQFAHQLEESVQARLAVLTVLRNERVQGLMGDVEGFLRRTEELQSELSGFFGIYCLDSDGVIQWVAPAEGNSAAVGRNVFDFALAAPDLRAARDSRMPTMTATMDIYRDGRTFSVFVPELDVSGDIAGFVNGVFLVDPLIEGSLGAAVSDSFFVEIREGASEIYSNAQSDRGTESDSSLQASSSLRLLDREWSLRLRPKPGAFGMDRGRDRWILVGGLGLAAAIAFAVRLSFVYLENARRRAEERAQLEVQLQSARRMEAIGRLAGGVAHDFNNLLTVIYGNARVAKGLSRTNPVAEDAIELILSASERGSALTKRLLTFSSQQVVQVRPLHLNEEIADLRPMLERLVREDIALSFELEASDDVVEMDPAQVSQILMNLVVNAIDAMPGGGSLRVITKNPAADLREVVLSVADTGEGMSEETRSRAVDPFFTTKPAGRGTGIGLATVFGEVTRVGGQLEIRTRVGEGTTIDLTLPLTGEEIAGADTPADQSDSEDDSCPCRVLLVEDEDAVRRVAMHALKSAGHEVVMAGDGEEALELVAGGAEFDVVVTDAVMPRLGGVDLIRELRTQRDDLGAVLLSGYSEDLLQSSPESIGAAFVSKPFKFDELTSSVDRAYRDVQNNRSRA